MEAKGLAEASRGEMRGLTKAEARVLASAMVERLRYAQDTGRTFGGLRDLNSALGYKADLKPADYRQRYERGGIAETIVEFYPNETWAGGAEIIENPDPGTTTLFEKAISELFKRLDVWARLLRADILAGLGRYSALLIGVDGKLGELSTELRKSTNPDAILGLYPIDEEGATIQSLVSDPGSPRFGLPESYMLNLGALDGKTIGQSTVCHWSRIIHVAEGALKDDVFGKPRLRAVWNRLDDLEKVVGGGSEAAWLRMDSGMQLDLDPDVELSEPGKAELREQLEDYRNKVRPDLYTKGITVKQLSAPVAGFGPNAAAIMDQIAGTTRIPQRVLLGSELGQLASGQDRNNVDDTVHARWRKLATPLVGAIISRLDEYFQIPTHGEYETRWPRRDQLTEIEKSEVVLKKAQANAANVRAGGGLIETANEIRDRTLSLEKLEMIAPTDAAPPGATDPPPAQPPAEAAN